MHGKWANDLRRIRPWSDGSEQRLAELPINEGEAVRQARVRGNRADSSLIDAELQDAGVPFDIGELPNVKADYREALPVLLRHLEIEHSPDIEESIVRALTVPYGGEEVFLALLGHLRRNGPRMRDSTLFAIGNALARTSRVGNNEDLVRVAENEVMGDARLGPLLKLASSKNSNVVRIATAFLAQDVYPWYAIRALRKARAFISEADVRKYLASEDREVRAEARRFMKALERAAAGSARPLRGGGTAGRVTTTP